MKFDPKNLAVGSTICVALLSGYFVQNKDHLMGGPVLVQPAPVMPSTAPTVDAPRFSKLEIVPLSADLPVVEEQPILIASADNMALPQMPREPAPAPSQFSSDAAALAERLTQIENGALTAAATGSVSPYGLPCETQVSAKAGPAATVILGVSSSCRTSERVEVMHDRLRFAVQTDGTGMAEVSVPALGEVAVFILQFEDGEVATATARIPEAADFDRVAIQWSGDNAMQIHAYEFGAGYFDDGHVWNENPRTASFAQDGKGGFLSVLGDPDLTDPLMAEVYSYPQGASRTNGVVRVSIEAEVTAANCEREISAETLQPGYDGTLQSADVTLAVPSCDAVGEFLVLKNMIRDLKLAAN